MPKTKTLASIKRDISKAQKKIDEMRRKAAERIKALDLVNYCLHFRAQIGAYSFPINDHRSWYFRTTKSHDVIAFVFSADFPNGEPDTVEEKTLFSFVVRKDDAAPYGYDLIQSSDVHEYREHPLVETFLMSIPIINEMRILNSHIQELEVLKKAESRFELT